MYPAQAVYQCAAGYRITGTAASSSASRYSRIDGSGAVAWEGEPFTCEGQWLPCMLMMGRTVCLMISLIDLARMRAAMACPVVDPPVNGAVSVSNGGVFPSTASYSCSRGFVMNPSAPAVRTCTALGTTTSWAAPPPICIGEWIIRDPSLVHSKEVRWFTVTHVSTVGIAVPEVASIANAEVVFSADGALAQYVVANGYEPRGDPVRACRDAGTSACTLDGGVPTIRGKDSQADGRTAEMDEAGLCCIMRLAADVDECTWMPGTCTSSGATCVNRLGSYACMCADGLGTGGSTECPGTRCPVLAAPHFGSVFTSNANVYPSTATYACTTGYELVGPASRTCQAADGVTTWTFDVPTCARKRCYGCNTGSCLNALIDNW
jgi:hypothetical protein